MAPKFVLYDNVKWKTVNAGWRYGTILRDVPAGALPNLKGIKLEHLDPKLLRSFEMGMLKRRKHQSYLIWEYGAVGPVWWRPEEVLLRWDCRKPKSTIPPHVIATTSVNVQPTIGEQQVKVLFAKPRRPDHRDDLASLFQIASAGTRTLQEREAAAALYLKLYNALWALEQPKEALEHTAQAYPRDQPVADK